MKSNAIDFASFEGSKENIQPLKEGRNAAKLVHALHSSSKDLAAQKRDWEEKIAQYDGSDPLSIWKKYIKWMQENYPSGSNKSEFLDVLERCTRLFKDNEDYKNRESFIKIWIIYADSCTNPLDVFHFMYSNNVGTYVAIFYEAWAIVEESLQNYKEARKIYEMGVKMKAKPLDKLENSFMQFEYRMVRRTVRQALGSNEASEPTSSSENSGARTRAPLNSLSQKEVLSSYRQANSRSALATITQDESSVSKMAANKQTKRNNPEFEIFVEGEEPSAAPSKGGWAVLGTEKERLKENHPQTTTWNNPLKKTSLPATKKEDIQIFQGAEKPTEVHAYNSDLILIDGEEFSFEEIRAARKPYFEEEMIAEDPKQNIVKNQFEAEDLTAMTASLNLTQTDFSRVAASPTITMTIGTKQAWDDIMKEWSAPLENISKSSTGNVNRNNKSRDSLSISPSTSPTSYSSVSSLSADSFTPYPPTNTFNFSMVSNVTNNEEDEEHWNQLDNQENLGQEQMHKLSHGEPARILQPISEISDKPSKLTNGEIIRKNLALQQELEDDQGFFEVTTTQVVPLVQNSSEFQFDIYEDPELVSPKRPKISNCIDPFNETLIKTLLQELSPPLSKHKGYYNMSKSAPRSVAALKAMSKKSKKDDNVTLDLDHSTLRAVQLVGSGAFASVYHVENDDTWNLRENNFALKVFQQNAVTANWEFYTIRRIQSTVPEPMYSKFPKAFSCQIYSDYSFLLMNYCPQGTLQDVVNSYKLKGNTMNEILAMYYTIELLYTVASLHEAGIIHGDIKPDNLLVLNDDLIEQDNWQDWYPSCNITDAVWRHKGLRLIDFGRSIDRTLLPNGTTFTGNCHADGFGCIEMQTGKPWTLQIDWYGICAVAYCMLHGSYMEVVFDERTQKWKPKQPFKRYWQASLWEELFDTVMNIKEQNLHPQFLTPIRKKFEDFIAADQKRAKSVKVKLCEQEMLMFGII